MWWRFKGGLELKMLGEKFERPEKIRPMHMQLSLTPES